MPPKKNGAASKKRAKPAAQVFGGRGSEWSLCDKYAPRTTADLVVFGKTTQKVKDWIEARVGEEDLLPEGRLLVLAGRPGIGKSAMVETVCAELGVDVWRWYDEHGVGGSDWRPGERTPFDVPYESQIAQFTDAMKGAMYPPVRRREREDKKKSNKSFFSSSVEDDDDDAPLKKKTKRSLLLLDEWPDVRFGGDEFRATLRMVSRFSERPAILLVSENVTEKTDAKRAVDALIGEDLANDAQFVEYVEVNAVTELKIKARIEAVARAERKIIRDDDLASIAAEADGDLRAALNALEFRLLKGSTASSLGLKDDDDAHRLKGDAVSDLHAIGRLLRARKDEEGHLTFDPDRVVRRMNMGPDAAAAFLQFNCVDFFTNDVDLAQALDDLSQADLFCGRLYSTHFQRDSGDAVYPEAYIATILGRTCAARNTQPAASSFRPIKKPRVYDVISLLAKHKKQKTRAPTFDFDKPPTLSRTFFPSNSNFIPLSSSSSEHLLRSHDEDFFHDGEADSGLLPEDDILEDD